MPDSDQGYSSNPHLIPVLLFSVPTDNAKAHGDRNRPTDVLLETAHQRLYPSLTGPSYLVLRSRKAIFSKWVSQFGRGNLRVLDIGGRYQPYRPLLGNRVEQYVAVDLIKTALVDVLADGEALPFAPNVFDLVIATQVLEYFREPSRGHKANPHAAQTRRNSACECRGLCAQICRPRALEIHWPRFAHTPFRISQSRDNSGIVQREQRGSNSESGARHVCSV